MESNQNQPDSVPFKTYFVTDYIGDKTETLEQEKILEEQLIRDLELMGSEVELVDDSHRTTNVAPTSNSNINKHQQQVATNKLVNQQSSTKLPKSIIRNNNTSSNTNNQSIEEIEANIAQSNSKHPSSQHRNQQKEQQQKSGKQCTLNTKPPQVFMDVEGE